MVPGDLNEPPLDVNAASQAVSSTPTLTVGNAEEWTTRVLAVTIPIAMLVAAGYSRFADAGHLEIVKEVVGALRDAMLVVVSYYFGSSRVKK